MQNINKPIIIISILTIIFGANFTLAAHDKSEPKLLPDNPFYFIKNWQRGLKSLLTFDPVNRAELKLQFSSEKLTEAQALAEKNKDAKIIKKAIENYNNETDKIKKEVEKFKTIASPKISEFLDKFTQQQLLHRQILVRLETQVPPEILEKIKETREKHLEKFKEVMIKIEGNAEKKMEAVENLISDLRDDPAARERLLPTREKILKEINNNENCQILLPVTSNYCKDGRILIEKDPADGCPLALKCLIPGEFSAPPLSNNEPENFCITLWNPVCGKNGKTYSNDCFAKSAKAEIDHGGTCGQKPFQTPKSTEIKTKSFPNNIEISGFAFSPAEIKVKTGETITFTNKDAVAHNVISGENVIIPEIVQNQTWSYGVPKTPQIIEYACGLHPAMKGKIIVEK